MKYILDQAEERRRQQLGEQLIKPHIRSMLDMLSQVQSALYLGSSKLVWIVPESDWADFPREDGRIGTVFGLEIVSGAVDSPMLAIRCGVES